MLTLTITITGKTQSDLKLALDEVEDKVMDGYTSGLDKNEGGAYQFTIDGEEEDA